MVGWWVHKLLYIISYKKNIQNHDYMDMQLKIVFMILYMTGEHINIVQN